MINSIQIINCVQKGNYLFYLFIYLRRKSVHICTHTQKKRNINPKRCTIEKYKFKTKFAQNIGNKTIYTIRNYMFLYVNLYICIAICIYIAISTYPYQPKKFWGGNEVLPKFCDVCPNHDFRVHFGYDKKIV